MLQRRVEALVKSYKLEAPKPKANAKQKGKGKNPNLLQPTLNRNTDNPYYSATAQKGSSRSSQRGIS